MEWFEVGAEWGALLGEKHTHLERGAPCKYVMFDSDSFYSHEVPYDNPRVYPAMLDVLKGPGSLEERLLEFARTHGPLGVEEDFYDGTGRDRGEDWNRWIQEAQLLFAAEKFGRCILDGGSFALLLDQRIKWRNTLVTIDLPVPKGSPRRNLKFNIFDITQEQYKLSLSNATEYQSLMNILGRRIFTEIVSGAAPRLVARVENGQKMGLTYHPWRLRDQLWYALMLDVTGQAKHRVCKYCQQHYDATDKKSDNFYCCDDHKDAAKRKPFYQMRELRAKGLSPQEIAEHIGKNVDWVVRNTEKPPLWFSKPKRQKGGGEPTNGTRGR